ncbi:MAG: hypothetical protein IPH39_05830 [Sulfuritalea sp.]|nr:hypothetical protein [Sulfuritalea sp.]
MPGHMLTAECPCGFRGDVMPGVSEKLGMSHMVVAYDPGCGQLITMIEQEAVKRGLEIFSNPYLTTRDEPLAVGKASIFRCPKCGETRMRFIRNGFWD